MLPDRFARRERTVVGAAFMTPVSPTDSRGGNGLASRNGRHECGPYNGSHSQDNSSNSIIAPLQFLQVEESPLAVSPPYTPAPATLPSTVRYAADCAYPVSALPQYPETATNASSGNNSMCEY